MSFRRKASREENAWLCLTQRLENDSGELGDFVGNSTKTGPLERVTHLLLAALGDQVFLLDGDAVVSLDLNTGETTMALTTTR